MLKRLLLAMALVGAALLAGCSSGSPKVTSPETKYDFGEVPVVSDMSQAKTREFVIKNEGTGDLKITGVQVKLLQGCWPPDVTVGSTVVKPGKQTSFVFPFAMHAGMGGPHHFEIHVKTNDPQTPDFVFDIRANAIEPKK